MAELFTVEHFLTLLMLILLQAVLGFDNLLYISLESKRVEPGSQQRVRRIGIGLAIFLRIALLIVVVNALEYFHEPMFSLGQNDEDSLVRGAFNLESVVILAGGAFILYTALKEIFHMLSMHDLDENDSAAMRSTGTAIFWIVLMNLVFSFDSILSAMALTDSVVIMAAAIVVSGILMMVLADHVATFLERNRMYEVLGLFILFIVGVMLVSEGGEKAGLSFVGHHVEAMPKSTFYFVLGVLIIVDVIQGRYQKKLLAKAAARAENEVVG